MNAFDLATARELGPASRSSTATTRSGWRSSTGAGDKAFCAGADLKKMHGGSHDGGIGELWDHEKQCGSARGSRWRSR